MRNIIRIENGSMSGPIGLEYAFIDAVLKLMLNKISIEEYSKLV